MGNFARSRRTCCAEFDPPDWMADRSSSREIQIDLMLPEIRRHRCQHASWFDVDTRSTARPCFCCAEIRTHDDGRNEDRQSHRASERESVQTRIASPCHIAQ